MGSARFPELIAERRELEKLDSQDIAPENCNDAIGRLKRIRSSLDRKLKELEVIEQNLRKSERTLKENENAFKKKADEIIKSLGGKTALEQIDSLKKENAKLKKENKNLKYKKPPRKSKKGRRPPRP